jgi:16S rRNA (guanine527-N7)-methyltransferase
LNPATLADLRQGAAELGIALDEPALRRLVDYLELLGKWNRVYNLTAIRDEGRMVTHHLLDSLAVLPHLPPGALLDVGSGGGMPGIPIAIAQPARAVTVLDSNQKKGAFLKQAVMELELKNVQVAVERIEDHRPARPYEIVISRAFSDLADFAGLAGRCVAAGGRLAAMKGVQPDDEIQRLPAAWHVERSVPLAVPRLDAARHLVLLQRRGDAEGSAAA